MLPPLLTNALDSDVEVNQYKMSWLVNLIFSSSPSFPYLPLKCCVLLQLSGNNGCSSHLIEKKVLEQLLTWKNGFVKHLGTSDCGTLCSCSALPLSVVTCQFLSVSFCSPCLFVQACCLKPCVLQGSTKPLTTAIVPLLCITNL